MTRFQGARAHTHTHTHTHTDKHQDKVTYSGQKSNLFDCKPLEGHLHSAACICFSLSAMRGVETSLRAVNSPAVVNVLTEILSR